MIRRCIALSAVLLVGCAHGVRRETPTPGPALIAEARGATPGQLDSLWAAAETAHQREKWDDVVKVVQRFMLELPAGDARASKARLYLGDAYIGKHEYLDAAREFRRVSDENPLDPLAPDGLLRVGDAYAKLWRRPELDATYGQTALATYQELLSRYPGTEAAKQAQLRIGALDNLFAQKQFKSAQYYMRLKAYDSAILYLKDLVVSYPRAALVPEALVRLIRAYRGLSYVEDVQETCEYLRKYHPTYAPGTATCAGVAPPAAPAAPAS